MKKSPQKTIVIIAGPTAVGKTSVAIQLAKHFKTEIISADSRQCYKEMRIGVASPSAIELDTVPHHFIASHSINEKVTAVTFENYALRKANSIFNKQDVAIMVGGTGLYIKAFCEGLDTIPAIDESIRKSIIKKYETNGRVWLQNELLQKDTDYAAHGEMENPQRMMRALEVFECTGQSILTFQKGNKASREFNIIKIGLELPREELNRHINTRVEAMMAIGLLEEVSSLMPCRHLNALQTVGYTEIFEHLDGNITLGQAIESIKSHTRQYAKRQMTWFKKDASINWLSTAEVDKIIKLVETDLT